MNSRDPYAQEVDDNSVVDLVGSNEVHVGKSLLCLLVEFLSLNYFCSDEPHTLMEMMGVTAGLTRGWKEMMSSGLKGYSLLRL